MESFAIRDLKVEDDWTLECPKFALGDVMVEGMGLKMPFGEVMEICWRWAYRCHPKKIVEPYLQAKTE